MAAPGRWCPRPYRVVGRRRETERHLDAELEPARRRAAARFRPRASSTCSTPSASGEVPISISGDPARRGPLVHTVRAVGAATAAICAVPSRATCSACADPSAAPGRSASAGGADVVIVAGGHRAGAAAPGLYRRSLAEREQLRPRRPALRRAHARRSCSTPTSCERWREAGLERRRHRRQRRGRAGPGSVGVVTCADRRRRASTRRATVAFIVRARGDDALHGRRPARAAASTPDRRPRLDRAQHEVRGRPLRALPVRPHVRLPRRARCSRYAAIERLLPSQGGVMAAMRAKPKLAVWKFASCDGCQLSLLDCEDELLALAERGRDRLLPRGDAGRPSRGPTTCRWSRARSPPPRTPSGSSEVRARLARAGHDRRLRDRGRHPGAAQLRRRRGVRRDRLRHARVHLDARRPRRRSPPTSRSTSSCRAARSTSASCSR